MRHKAALFLPGHALDTEVMTTALHPAYRNAKAREWRCTAAPREVTDFHRRLPGYAPTPLTALPGTPYFVKDESSRLGLPSFKALGASWGIRQALADARPGARLVTATDGNHGRAVAHFARLLGVPAQVFVPEFVGTTAVAAIRAEGATVVRVPGDYDAAVATAAAEDGVLVQDTAWPGYERIPAAIVDGYSTLFREIDEQLAGSPALVVVPMGVGSLAQAAVRHYRSAHRGVALLGVEPVTSACVLASLHAGRPVTVRTAPTSMAGLNCGTPSSIAWPWLRDGLDGAVSVDEEQAARAMEVLAAAGINAGPCGAATLAAASLVPHEGPVVLINTEGRHG
ncbi:hypothetical protein KALB_6688 [Kutzneria albida DSM 43870]|uniref:Tryptophan synthase beta chain-like PALP domain-containing protein n=2 Tax=Kutzneria TaxID=43356 RepID=W5WHG2_9PSEU|nr:hypothetical protein KALB_6688 [Kutzneria albida DSM 43870]